jgi:hypothetical protein
MSSASAEVPPAGQSVSAGTGCGGRRFRRRPPAANATLQAAVRALAEAADRAGVMGAYHDGSPVYQRAAAIVSLGDKEGAIKALPESIRLRPAGEYRALAIMQARIAELSLHGGRIDDAVAAWHRFRDIYPIVSVAGQDQPCAP